MLERIKRILPASILGWVQLLMTMLCWAVILTMIGWVLWPTLKEMDTIGSHDWDQMESHRYLVTKSILRFHQFPFWNPYACGGHPNWGGFESGVTVVSPWLPFYLFTSLPHALRAEVWGSALLSAVGAWLLAGRFTSSPAARALVVVVFSVNGRWTLQMSTGHTWHLAYGLTPWVLYFFDRAVGADPTRGTPRRRHAVLCAAALALMIYTGGIYPFPHAVVAVALYGVFVAALDRSTRPLVVGLTVAAMAFGFAAPKLLPIFEVMHRWPRIIDSTESLDLTALVQILTSTDQDVFSRPANVNAKWGWHEFGMYVGWAVVCLLVVAALLGRGLRESPLKWIGLLFVVLGFGAFDLHAPWSLVHELPIFKSQHVPSRWQYPGLLLLLTVAAAFLERALRRTGRFRPLLELVLFWWVTTVARDVATVAKIPVAHAFMTPMPATPEATATFHTEIHLPAALAYNYDITSLSLTAEMANIGTIDCSTFPGLNQYVRDANGRASGLGARGVGDPAYRGEVFIADGVGHAEIAKWTPNEVTVAVRGAQAGEYVVLNQNWDGGWSANGAPATNISDQVAARLHDRDSTVVFRYRPQLWWPGVSLFLATVGAVAAAGLLRRRPRRQRAQGHPVNATLSTQMS